MTSPEFEKKAKILTGATSRRRFLKTLAATTIGGALGVGTIGTALAAPANWDVPLWGTVIDRLIIRMVTGNDDLRQGSKVSAFVNIANSWASQWLGTTLNDGSVGWSNGSFNGPFTFVLQPDPKSFGSILTVENIKEIRISFLSGICITCTGDNWNMNAIRILYPKVPNPPPPTVNIDWADYAELYYESGSPVNRFTSPGSSWSTGINPHWNPI
jgi:hypothetical protein